MLNKFKSKLMVFGFTLAASVTVAHAVPFIIETEQGTCYITGQSQTHWIYTCQNGALWYVRKNQGNPGGGGDDDDNGCPPDAILC